MTTGLPNDEKSRIRQLLCRRQGGPCRASGANPSPIMDPGTCTFYGTANSNQMLMEIMASICPASSSIPARRFAKPSPARQSSGRFRLPALAMNSRPAGEMIDERSIVNGVVGPACHGWLYQPHHAHRRDGPRCGHSSDLAGYFQSFPTPYLCLPAFTPTGLQT